MIIACFYLNGKPFVPLAFQSRDKFVEYWKARRHTWRGFRLRIIRVASRDEFLAIQQPFLTN